MLVSRIPLPYCRFSPVISSDSQGSGAGLGGATGGFGAAAGAAGFAATGAVVGVAAGAEVAGVGGATETAGGAVCVDAVGVVAAPAAGAGSDAFSAACDGLVGFVSSDIAVCLSLVVSQNPHAHLLLTADEPRSEVLRSLAFVINVTLEFPPRSVLSFRATGGCPTRAKQRVGGSETNIARPGVKSLP